MLAGIVIVIFHDTIRRAQDESYSRDPILKVGDWWTGKYTRGGLLFVRGVIILVGIGMIYGGISILLQGE